MLADITIIFIVKACFKDKSNGYIMRSPYTAVTHQRYLLGVWKQRGDQRSTEWASTTSNLNSSTWGSHGSSTGPGRWGMWIFRHCHRTLYPKTTSKFQGRDCWPTASPKLFTVLTPHKCKKSTECRHHLLQATLYSQKWSLSDSQLPAPKALEYSCLNCSLSEWE